MSSPEAKNLEAISRAIDQHNATCEYPAVAIEMRAVRVRSIDWSFRWGDGRGIPAVSGSASSGSTGRGRPRFDRISG